MLGGGTAVSVPGRGRRHGAQTAEAAGIVGRWASGGEMIKRRGFARLAVTPRELTSVRPQRSRADKHTLQHCENNKHQEITHRLKDEEIPYNMIHHLREKATYDSGNRGCHGNNLKMARQQFINVSRGRCGDAERETICL